MAASREKVLYFEPQPSEQTAALKTVLVRMGVRIKNVEAVSAGQTVGFLLNRKGFEPTDATARCAFCTDDGAGRLYREAVGHSAP